MALTEEHQLKLSQLREQYQDQESQLEINRFEQELSALTAEVTDLKHPIFKRFAALALKRTNEANALLMNDVSILNDGGRIIARERDMWRSVLTAFNPKERDNALQALENLIDEKLHT